MMMEAESSVMASFDFLSGGMEVDDDDDMGDDLDDVDDEVKQPKRKVRVTIFFWALVRWISNFPFLLIFTLVSICMNLISSKQESKVIIVFVTFAWILHYVCTTFFFDISFSFQSVACGSFWYVFFFFL
jgi:hypothetical protein